MRRLARYILNTFATLSLLLCAATAGLWVRTFYHQNHASVLLHGTRYTFISDHGKLVIYRPPMGGAAGLPPATQFIAGIHNYQIEWEGVFHRRNDAFISLASPWPHAGTAAYQLFPMSRPAWIISDDLEPLLAALEDPDKFVAAHLFLTLQSYNMAEKASEGWKTSFVWKRMLLEGSGTYDGLKVELSIPGIPDPPDGSDSAYDRSVPYGTRIDLKQLPAIREQWHRRLDKRFAVVPFWRLAAACLVLPGFRIVLRAYDRICVRRLRRQRICVKCGYDLRATPERCPECGTIPAPAV